MKNIITSVILSFAIGYFVYSQENLKTKSFDGISINYSVFGDGKDVILFVHCWMCDQTYWRNQIDYFKDDYKVVTVDLGGHGKSGNNHNDWSISTLGNDVLSVINTLKFKNLVLVGHSMGGMVVLDAASKLNADNISVVLVDVIQNKFWPIPKDTVKKFILPFENDFKNYTKQYVKSIMFVKDSNDDLIEWIANDMSMGPPEIGVKLTFNLLTADYDEQINALTERQIPKFLINSDKWPLDSVFLDNMGFINKNISNVGHFIMLEKPQEFNELLKNLLRGTDTF